MITDERKRFLEDLAFKASVAGNKDCFNMSEEEFAEEIKQDEEWIVYKEFAKQRKIGFENKIMQVKSSKKFKRFSHPRSYILWQMVIIMMMELFCLNKS